MCNCSIVEVFVGGWLGKVGWVKPDTTDVWLTWCILAVVLVELCVQQLESFGGVVACGVVRWSCWLRRDSQCLGVGNEDGCGADEAADLGHASLVWSTDLHV